MASSTSSTLMGSSSHSPTSEREIWTPPLSKTAMGAVASRWSMYWSNSCVDRLSRIAWTMASIRSSGMASMSMAPSPPVGASYLSVHMMMW